jgi:hypothetical protein
MVIHSGEFMVIQASRVERRCTHLAIAPETRSSRKNGFHGAHTPRLRFRTLGCQIGAAVAVPVRVVDSLSGTRSMVSSRHDQSLSVKIGMKGWVVWGRRLGDVPGSKGHLYFPSRLAPANSGGNVTSRCPLRPESS